MNNFNVLQASIGAESASVQGVALRILRFNALHWIFDWSPLRQRLVLFTHGSGSSRHSPRNQYREDAQAALL
jgi:hypothetical protein